jgi:hypothetical protein
MHANQILANAGIIYSSDAIANAIQKLKDTVLVVICLMKKANL